jgi:hypothetical protein
MGQPIKDERLRVMSILNRAWRFLMGKSAAATPARYRIGTSASGTIGCTKPVCPHCQQGLEKMPARKKKCPSCGEFIYVRTRPADRVKVLVTEEQAAAIEEQWVRHETEAELARLRGLPGYTRARAKLRRLLGREPDEHEVVIELARGELEQHKAERDWGLYRNAQLQIASELRTLNRLEASFAAYLVLCYLDLNGPNNVGGTKDPEVLAEFPPFDPKDAGLTPGILMDVLALQQGLGLSVDQTKEAFFSATAKSSRLLPLPVSPEVAWLRLREGLFGTSVQ